METKFQTSFIPKQPVTESGPIHTSSASIFFLVSFIVFMVSLASAGGVLIYESIVDRSIANEKTNLTKNQNAFDPTTISELTRLNDRINSASSLLKQHKSVTSVFQLLTNTTLENVQFSDFNYLATDDKITLSMKGTASSYETVALQAKEFTAQNLQNVFRSPIFSDLNLDTKGNVTFGFSTGVDPFLVDYYKLKGEELNSGGFVNTTEAQAQTQPGAQQ